MICVGIIVVSMIYTLRLYRWIVISNGKDGFRDSLTPTQKFILAASSPTVANNYKCVIDIWGTCESEVDREKAIKLFEWSWGEFTCENTRMSVDDCLNHGYHEKFKEYCNADMSSSSASGYTDFERELLEETKRKYPKQGLLGWDLVRILSIVGGAYMGGVMEYGEAVRIAFETGKLLQENFSSWDDMVGSYTLGYQLWRGKRKKDRLKYYKRLKKSSWIYRSAPWDTVLKEEEL